VGLLAVAAPLVYAAGKHLHDHSSETKEHGAHVHGQASLNLALEGSELHIELDSPAANIVGFEHMPKSDADHAALDKAVAVLRDGGRLFEFNDDVNCRLEHAEVGSPMLNHHDDEKHAADQPKDTHSDMQAVYHFECGQPEKLEQISIRLFELLPRLEKLAVQYVVGTKQGAVELSESAPVLAF